MEHILVYLFPPLSYISIYLLINLKMLGNMYPMARVESFFILISIYAYRVREIQAGPNLTSSRIFLHSLSQFRIDLYLEKNVRENYYLLQIFKD